MKKSKPLYIRIPEPCNSAWNNMTASEGGRFCDQCSKTVLDFSGMTDIELVHYFQTKPINICGRFNITQLDRAIIPLKPKRLLPSLYRKSAAAFFALMSFRFSTAQVQKKVNAPITSQPSVSRLTSQPDSVIITGKVMQSGSPIANAKVSFDGIIETQTNAEGRFQFKINAELIALHNLYFSYPGYKRAVRNFHPMMGSTEYNVELESPEECARFYNMGYPVFRASDTISFPSLSFTKNMVQLSDDQKLLLTGVAEQMRTEPQVVVKLVAYGKGANEIKQAKRKLTLISNYLIQSQGINKDSIKQVIEKISGVELVDILQDRD